MRWWCVAAPTSGDLTAPPGASTLEDRVGVVLPWVQEVWRHAVRAGHRRHEDAPIMTRMTITRTEAPMTRLNVERTDAPMRRIVRCSMGNGTSWEDLGSDAWATGTVTSSACAWAPDCLSLPDCLTLPDREEGVVDVRIVEVSPGGER